MKPLQVLEMQEDLRRRLSDPNNRVMAGAFAQVAGLAERLAEGELFDNPEVQRMVADVAKGIELADAYRVTEEMSDVVRFAASKLDETDTFDTTLAPTPWGFVRFESPLPLVDIRGRTMLISFATWGPSAYITTSALGQKRNRPGMMFTFWNDNGTHPDAVHAELLKMFEGKEGFARVMDHLGRWGMIGLYNHQQGEQVGAEMLHMGADEPVVKSEDLDGWPLAEVVGEFTNPVRYMHALWLLLGQTVTEVRDETKGFTKKQSARIGKARIPKKVSVIRLRRKDYGPSHGESRIEWQRRWLVRGHWRWQPVGPGRQERVRIWIHGYVKGPADKPLIVPQKVYELRD